ncbi:MAG TPA: lactate utilization protein [Parafilimonas sp.]|nr:lactate utilization protein [Parafilimonas sp.]
MKTTSARNNILKKIKQALNTPVPVPFGDVPSKQEFFLKDDNDPGVQFAENFARLQGRFSFCSNDKELTAQLQTLFAARQWNKIFLGETGLKTMLAQHNLPLSVETDLADCDAAITSCECLIARTGSIVLSSVQSGRTISVYAPVHICVAYTNQLVYDIKDGLDLLKKKYPGGLPSSITFASGPSRTADIEKTLVTGVHGPKEVFCFLVQSS